MDDSSSADKPETFDSLVIAAERILSDVFGSQIRFTNVERLSESGRRNLILRCLSSPISDLPSSYIIKKVESDSYDPEDADSWDSQRFFSDWIGSQFLSALGGEANHGPQFYGGNRELGFIILEDLGHHRSLVEPLLHEDAISAEKSLFRYSTRLGKLHADTHKELSAFELLFHSVNSTGKSFAPKASQLEQSIQQVQTSLEGLGVLAEATLLQELTAVATAVVDPGPFLAYIHGDPCPDNVFDTPDQLRLIDFEFGHFGHALIDATYARMIFPTCWCANRLPRAIVAQMESRYRRELIQGCSEAQEDRVFELALVTICGFWLLNTLARHLERALEEDQSWGLASLRQRVLARLEAFVNTSEDFSQLPALRGTASRLLTLLGKRWPESTQLPLYPAFQ
jgi:phosphotransferase family enzyme